ncbi:MAG TPA: NAD(+) kinase, partial [Treponema sp.]|nr:NAD(+) kinase [Treponema sp.]
TAYSASAGGPIIDPELDALVLTPINSFSLSSRPLVLSPNGEIGITVLPSRVQDIIITVDGQEPVSLQVGDCIKIRKTADKVKLVGCTTEKFYDALRSKLNWSGGPHAGRPDN